MTAPFHSPTRTPWSRLERLAFVAAAALMALPIWLSDFPPLVDIPQHAAQAATLLRLLDPASPLHSVFELHLYTPYLLGYMLLALFAQLASIVTATKLVLSAAVIGFPLACSLLRRESGGDRHWDWLTLPLGYGFAFKLGNLNFIVGAPLAILYLALLVRHLRAGAGKAAGLLAVGLLLVASHAVLFAFFAALALVTIGVETPGWRQRSVKALPVLLPLVFALPPALGWAGQMTDSGATGVWDLSLARPLRLLALPYLGPDHLWPTDFFQTAAGLAILMLPLLGGARFRPWRGSALFFGFCALFLLVPLEYGDATILWPRFAMFLVPLYLTALGPAGPDESPGSGWRGAVLAAMVAVAAWGPFQFGIAYRSFAAHIEPLQRLLARLPPGRAVLHLPLGGDRSPVRWGDLHFPLWYQAISGGTVDWSAAGLSHLPVRYRPEQRRTLPQGFEFEPALDWRAHRGWIWDYFVVRAEDDPARLFAGADCPIRLRGREGGWWLYERERGNASNPTSCAARYPELRQPG